MILFGSNESSSLESSSVKNKETKGKISENNNVSKEEELAIRLVKEVDINNLTPMEALLKFNELKKILS